MVGRIWFLIFSNQNRGGVEEIWFWFGVFDLRYKYDFVEDSQRERVSERRDLR